MNTTAPTITAWRRGRDLILKIEVVEDHYGFGPFLQRVTPPDEFSRSYELCFHRGRPEGEPKSHRRVQFEHRERDLPNHVRTLHVKVTPHDWIKIVSRHGPRYDAHMRSRR